MTVNADKLAEVYLKIKSKRDSIKRAFDEQDVVLKDQQETIKTKMLEICKAQNSSSINTEHGTIIKSVKRKYWPSDWEAMYDFIKKHEMPELLTRSLHQSNLKDFLEKNPDDVPPGLNIDAEESISVRKPRAK